MAAMSVFSEWLFWDNLFMGTNYEEYVEAIIRQRLKSPEGRYALMRSLALEGDESAKERLTKSNYKLRRYVTEKVVHVPTNNVIDIKYSQEVVDLDDERFSDAVEANESMGEDWEFNTRKDD